MQSNGDLHEIELRAVESISDLHCTSSNLEVTQSYLDRNQTRPSVSFPGGETSVNGLVTSHVLERGQGEPVSASPSDPRCGSQDRCECSCVCCQTTSQDKVFYALVLLLLLVSIAIGLLIVYYSGKMNKELEEISQYLDGLYQSVKQMTFGNHPPQSHMNFTGNIDPTINNI